MKKFLLPLFGAASILLLAAATQPTNATACECEVQPPAPLEGGADTTEPDCTPSGETPGFLSLAVIDNDSSDPVDRVAMNWYLSGSIGTPQQTSIGLCGKTNAEGVLVIASKPFTGDMLLEKRGYNDCVVPDGQIAGGHLTEIECRLVASQAGALEGRAFQCNAFTGLQDVRVDLLAPGLDDVLDTATTDGEGIYLFPEVAEGEYDLRFESASGLINLERGIVVRAGETTQFDHQLCECAVPNEDGVCVASCREIERLSFGGKDHEPQYLEIGEAPVYVAAADLNDDGLNDLVVARNESADKGISILWQEDSGDDPQRELAFSRQDLTTVNDTVFQEPAGRYDTGGREPTSVHIVDVNLDNRLDIVVGKGEIKNTGFNRTVSVYLQQEDGSFTDDGIPHQISSSCSGTSEVGIGLLNNDPYPDLVVAADCAGGLKKFTNRIPNPIENEPEFVFDSKNDGFLSSGYHRGIVVADVNSDGKGDVLTTDDSFDGHSYLSVLYSDSETLGDITDTLKIDYPTGEFPWGIAVGDFNADGRNDAVVANEGDGSITVLVQSGPPDNVLVAVGSEFSLGEGKAPVLVRIGDLDGDGLGDVAVSNRDNPNPTISILFGQEEFPFLSEPECLLCQPGGATRGLALVDIDHDGKLDIVTANPDTGSVAIHRQNELPNDGPTQPEILDPVDGTLLVTTRPSFRIANAIDPDGDALEYEWQVATSIDFVEGIVDSGMVEEDPSGETSFSSNIPLEENVKYYFRVRAREKEAGSGMGKASEYTDENQFLIPTGAPGSIQDCFIATAAYGSPLEPEVETLREFRDRYLKTNALGRRLVHAYYSWSPPLAQRLAEAPRMKTAVRWALAPTAWGAGALNRLDRAGWGWKLGILAVLGLAVGLWAARRRGGLSRNFGPER